MLLAPVPPVAHAAQIARAEFHAYRVTAAAGSERVEFSGDPAAGCADRGVCGISGVETFSPVRPEPGAIATFARISGRVLGQAVFSGGQTTASVTTAGSDGQPCNDSFFVPQAVITFRRAGLRVLATLHGPVGEPPLGQDAEVFATHCAGPRVADLAKAGVLPRQVVAVSLLRRPNVLLDLTAESPFSAAGFSGRVIADVKVRIKRDRRLERLLLASGTLTVTSSGTLGGAAP